MSLYSKYRNETSGMKDAPTLMQWLEQYALALEKECSDLVWMTDFLREQNFELRRILSDAPHAPFCPGGGEYSSFKYQECNCWKIEYGQK